MIEEEYDQKINFLSLKYDQSELKNDPDFSHPEARDPRKEKVESFRAPRIKQFGYLVVRAFRNIVRLPLASYIRAISVIITA